MKNLFLLSLFCFTASLAIGQIPADMPSTNKKGCYARGAIAVTYKDIEVVYYEYMGEGMPNGVEEKTIELRRESSKWVKKQIDEDCESSDPKDCLVWVLVKIPARRQTVLVVTDTINVKDFDKRVYKKRILAKQGKSSDWVEVICESKATMDLFMEISTALKAKGFLDEVEYENNPRLKSALFEYQKSNSLPVGNFNFLTLDALGVNYKY